MGPPACPCRAPAEISVRNGRTKNEVTVMSEPLARYREARPNGRRQFELFADRVIVTSKSAKADSVITVVLADLRPEPNLLRVRPKEFTVGLLMLVTSVGLGFFAILANVTESPLDDKTKFCLSLAGGCFLVSLVIIWKTVRKIEFTQFVSNHGTPLLDIADAGPQRVGFRSFVDTLIGQIRANQESASQLPFSERHD